MHCKVISMWPCDGVMSLSNCSGGLRQNLWDDSDWILHEEGKCHLAFIVKCYFNTGDEMAKHCWHCCPPDTSSRGSATIPGEEKATELHTCWPGLLPHLFFFHLQMLPFPQDVNEDPTYANVRYYYIQVPRGWPRHTNISHLLAASSKSSSYSSIFN